ncbi:sugar transporter [Fusarium acuminatum]|uniref:Sugar transporter n=1 Tax=Fusarium acuminatum TaxID=5515 RepID=A0ABZ2WLN2_9HYPO
MKSDKQNASNLRVVGAELAAVLPDDPKPWYRQGHLLKLNFCILSLSLLSSANGFDGSLMNGLLALSQWNDFMNQPTGAWLGFINVVYWIAVGIGAPIAGWAATRFGRKPTLHWALIFVVISSAPQAAAQNVAMFIVGRFVLGFATAIYGNAAPMLIAEIAYPTHRSIASALYTCGFYIGSIISAWAVFGTRDYGSSMAWRLPCILQMLCPLAAMPGLLLCSESPRWLISVDRTEEARAILIKIHAGGNVTSPLVQYEFAEIQSTIAAESASHDTASYAEMLSTRSNRWRTFITVTLGFFAQWTGNGVVSYYLALVLDTVGITSVKDQTLVSGCLQIWNFLFSVAASLLIDRLGRRMLYISSFFIMFIGFAIITGLSGSFASTSASGTGLAVIPFLFIYFAGYDISLTPLLLAYPVEIWPYRLRGRGLSLVWISTTLAIIFNVFVNPIALAAIGWKYYFVFMVIILAYGAVSFIFYPETRGHTLEQMAVIFGDQEDIHTDKQIYNRKSSVGEYKAEREELEK